jgi:hypothetical protein
MGDEQRFDRIDESLSRLSNYLVAFRGEMVQRLDLIEHRLDLAATSISTFDTRVAAITKAMLETGALSTKVLRD